MPSQTAREVFVVGLRNAHALESQALELMERQSERMTDFPQVQEKARAHAEETRAQMRRLEECLNSLGEDRSVLKDTTMSLLGNMAAMGRAVASDEILKNSFANYAFEHYEIASYKSLLTIARDAGFSNAAAKLQTSLEEEERMAAWIGSNIEQITRMYLSREERRAA